jgi:hypothetical protein
MMIQNHNFSLKFRRDFHQMKFWLTGFLILAAYHHTLFSEDFISNVFSSPAHFINQNDFSSWSSALSDEFNEDPEIIRTEFLSEETQKTSVSNSSNQPVAHAGDDVLAFVGKTATLNGGKSQPSGKIGVRWIQISGPQVKEAFIQGPNLVIVPPEQGQYEFLLVVASESQISEPDHVLLTAVNIPKEFQAGQTERVEISNQPEISNLSAGPDNSSSATGYESKDKPEKLMENLAFHATHSISDHSAITEELARLFTDIAMKMDLYASYAEVNEEMARRISIILDKSHADFQLWNLRVFIPLTSALNLWLRPSGFDLSNSAQWQNQFTHDQRNRFAKGFLAIASGFQSSSQNLVPSDLKTMTDVSH